MTLHLAFCCSVDVKFCSKTVPTVFSGEDNLTFNTGLHPGGKNYLERVELCKLLNFLTEAYSSFLS